MARYTGAVMSNVPPRGKQVVPQRHPLRYGEVCRRATAEPAGMHTFRRGKLTDYGIHLREKQKVKHYYGVLERQFRLYFSEANRGTETPARLS